VIPACSNRRLASDSRVVVVTCDTVIRPPLDLRSPIVGAQLFLVVIQDDSGGHAITWDAVFRNAPTPSAGTAGQRLSAEFRFDGVSWQCVGSSSAFG
jgi:hypothetical protein